MPYLTMSDKTRIYYEDWGKGETLVFSHGLCSSHLELRDFMHEFTKDYRCICYEQRGHGASDHPGIHMNVKRLGQDLHEIIEYLNLKDITAIGHSMGAASIFSYVNQYGCGKLKRIVSADMTPYMRNTVWEGGIGQGKWTDEDFMEDLDRMFDDVGYAGWYITKTIMVPEMSKIPAEMEGSMIAAARLNCNPLTMSSLWYSLYRTDQRPVMDKITVPFLYIMPETPLYSMVTADYIKEHVKGGFVLEKDFPGTSHNILMQKPHEVAERVKDFMAKY